MSKIITIKEPFNLKNERVDIYKIDDSPEYRKNIKNIKALKKMAKSHSVIHNVVAKEGRKRMALTLAAEMAVSAEDSNAETFPNVSAIGTSATAHTENSTKLHTETFRKNIAARAANELEFEITSYYYPEDCNGEFREEGIFMQADDEVADDGYLLSVITLSAADGDKSSSEALIIVRKFTINIS